MCHIARVKFPAKVAGGSVERIQVSVARTEVHRSLPDHRTRQVHVPGIGNGLVLRLQAVKALGLKTPLAAGGEFPFQFSVLRVESVELAIVTAEVDDPAGNCWSRGYGTQGTEFPVLTACGGVDGVKIVIVAPEIDDA